MYRIYCNFCEDFAEGTWLPDTQGIACKPVWDAESILAKARAWILERAKTVAWPEDPAPQPYWRATVRVETENGLEPFAEIPLESVLSPSPPQSTDWDGAWQQAPT